MHGAERRDINGKTHIVHLPDAIARDIMQSYSHRSVSRRGAGGMAFALHYQQFQKTHYTLAQRTLDPATNGVTAGKVCCQTEVPVKVSTAAFCGSPFTGERPYFWAMI